MSGIRVNFEISHKATRKSKETPEGFTHDWEVFVRSQEGADISHFVDKVVFNLHSSFPKPRRVVKEPPFSIKESGYAGFPFPIDIYLKNRGEPKKIQFIYNFNLLQTGCLKDRYFFQNPNEDFRRKLLKGGGIIVSNDSIYTNPDQESKSRDSFSNEKQQLVSKPKLSSENVKKHKTKEKTKEDVPLKTNSFVNLFGAPIQKPPKVSPDPKRIEKSMLKAEKKDKEISSSDKKSKHEHKESKTEKVKVKEERDKQKPDKIKNIGKDPEKIKEKSSKRPGERPLSPEVVKKKCLSPNRKVSSPNPLSSTPIKEEYKLSKNIENSEQKKVKTEDRHVEIKIEKEGKEKKKKDKKSHDREKERKDKKEHKKESHKNKESPKDATKGHIITKDTIKERETIKESSQSKEKPPKLEKPINKFSIENLKKTPPSNIDEQRLESHKVKDKSESERKHKHKKKDKKRDESREKHKESSKEKRHKHDKVREIPCEKVEHFEQRETPVPKEHSMIEVASPISVDSASQSSESKSGLTKLLNKTDDNISSHSDSEDSIIADDDDDVKIKMEMRSPEPIKREQTHSPEPIKREPTPEPEPEPEPELEPEMEPEPVIEASLVQVPQKEKSKKHKDKSKREEKRRKRKAAEEEDAENRKIAKAADPGPTNNDSDHGETSGSISIETKVQDNGVSSSLGEDGESGELSPDYMVQLRGLQQRIMMIKNNEDLERVVNLIAETGRYEVTTQTFDFDLCLLDRSTVQQLIQLVGC